MEGRGYGPLDFHPPTNFFLTYKFMEGRGHMLLDFHPPTNFFLTYKFWIEDLV